MNLKRTLLSLAIAGATAAPMIASAANGAVYGNIRYGISQTDSGVKGADAVSAFGNKASRFGIKGETDLGNGMTGYGHWEIGMFAAKLRELKVGVKGDFGNVYMGDKTNHAWDSVMSTDDTWWYGGSQHITDGVQSNAITYQGGFGAISFGVTAEMSGAETTTDAAGVTTTDAKQESVDTLEYVIGYDAGVAQFAFGVHDKSTVLAASDPEAVTGFLVKSTIGEVAVALDFQSQDGITATDADVTSTQLQLGYGSFLLQIGQQESSIGAVSVTPSTTVLTYTQSLGPDTSIWYEYASTDVDVAGTDNSTVIAATLKYNIM